MTTKLLLTSEEVDMIINGGLEEAEPLGYRFEEVFNDIPIYHPNHVMKKGETHRDYMEKDGREFRWYIFKDASTGIEHQINYSYNPEIENTVLKLPDSIQIVDKDIDF